MTPVRFGLIGVDSPHAASFTRLLGDGRTGAVAGGVIVAAWRGEASVDFPPSRDRIDAMALEVDRLGVPLLATPEDVAARSDALLVVASDARTHAGLFERLAPLGLPIYVDTRFAMRETDAERMMHAADANGVLALAGSPKRFAASFVEVLGRDAGRCDHIELHGAMPEQPGHPGLSWYGVHLVDLAVAAMGPGILAVERGPSGGTTLRWADGRTADLSGPASWQPVTRGSIVVDGTARSFEIVAEESMLTGLLAALVEAVRGGTPTVPHAQILDVVRAVELGS